MVSISIQHVSNFRFRFSPKNNPFCKVGNAPGGHRFLLNPQADVQGIKVIDKFAKDNAKVPVAARYLHFGQEIPWLVEVGL